MITMNKEVNRSSISDHRNYIRIFQGKLYRIFRPDEHCLKESKTNEHHRIKKEVKTSFKTFYILINTC